MGKFKGQVVFITGASSGIGVALAREFARQGADLLLTARRVDRLEALATELSDGGCRAIAVRCDVTRDGELERAAASARDSLGKINVVVANAGFSVSGGLESLGLEDYRRQSETNVFGVLRTVFATLDDLKRTRGHLVIIGSISGHIARPAMSAYVMSKFAVRGLAESLRPEVAPYGVTVTLINPGFVTTEIHRVNNQGVIRHDAVDPIPGWLRMPADLAARRIARAIARGRRETAISALGKAVLLGHRHAPRFVSLILRRLGM